MKVYKITYKLESGQEYHVYCSKNVKAEMQAIKEMFERTKTPLADISYVRVA